MKILKSIALLIPLATMCLAGPAAAQIADNPDRAFVEILHNILSGASPDFEAEARNTPTYREADEFNRATVLTEEVARLREQYTDVAQYDGITLAVTTSLGEWDAAESAFPVSLFRAGAYINIGPGVAFSNPIQARFWVLQMDDARDIIARLPTRSVIAEVTLKNLHVSAENGQRVTGDIASVEMKTPQGESLGRYDVAPPRQIDDSIDLGAAARTLSDTLKVPQLGTDLAVGLDWAQNNAEGVAWSVRSFSGPVAYEGMNEGPFPRFVPDSDVVRIGFSSTDENAKGVLRSAGFNITQLTNPNWFGAQLDCYTDDIADRCGVMTFAKQGDTHVLTEIIILDDFARTNFRELTQSILGDTAAAFTYDERTPTTVGTSIAYKFDGELYYLGQREAGGIPSFDLRTGYRDNYHAPVMLFGFGSEDGRAISVARISALSDGSNIVIAEPKASTEETEGQIDGLLTINPEWHEAIAAENCLTETGFGTCTSAATLSPSSNGNFYVGPTEETSRLLTKFNIYSEECRGAVGQENIEGWCDKRNEARDQLAAQGVCLGDTGFSLCATDKQENLPIFGVWDCDGGPMTIDADTYQGKPIDTIEENAGNFLVTMADGYRFATFDVTPTSFTWYSPQSGDSFNCRKP
ncbi:hypothetical protein ACG74X_20770 [Marivita sp. S0852]|uniref:hypothetical protein n=1 Tax=Marivita sp. S0852 TaxID=3373893 RepID=UPI00398214F2